MLENFTCGSVEDLAEDCVSISIPHALKYGPEVQRDRQHHSPGDVRCCATRNPEDLFFMSLTSRIGVVLPDTGALHSVELDRTEKNVRVFPWSAELCRKAGFHHTGSAEARETSTSSLRTSCGSFVQKAFSGLRAHARQTRGRASQLSRWPCDATAELRDSAEAQDMDNGPAPNSHHNSIRDATVHPYPKTTPSPPGKHSLGKSKSPHKRFLQLRSMGQVVLCPALGPSRSPSAFRRQ